jgi:hypothetical protein
MEFSLLSCSIAEDAEVHWRSGEAGPTTGTTWPAVS